MPNIVVSSVSTVLSKFVSAVDSEVVVVPPFSCWPSMGGLLVAPLFTTTLAAFAAAVVLDVELFDVVVCRLAGSLVLLSTVLLSVTVSSVVAVVVVVGG